MENFDIESFKENLVETIKFTQSKVHEALTGYSEKNIGYIFVLKYINGFVIPSIKNNLSFNDDIMTQELMSDFCHRFKELLNMLTIQEEYTMLAGWYTNSLKYWEQKNPFTGMCIKKSLSEISQTYDNIADRVMKNYTISIHVKELAKELDTKKKD